MITSAFGGARKIGCFLPSIGLLNILVFHVGLETDPVPLNWNSPMKGLKGIARIPNKPLAFIRTSKSISFLLRSILPSPVNFNERVVARKSLENTTPSLMM